MTSFGKELELFRKRSGITQYNLAKELNMSRSHINRIESGERKASKEIILKISDILKFDQYYLNKLFILAGLEPELAGTKDGFKNCYRLALELKNKGNMPDAEKLIEYGMYHFDNVVELHALLANLNLVKRNYEQAIKANEETIKLFDAQSKVQRKEIGITKAEVIHNLGYAYFERGLEKLAVLEKLIIESWDAKTLQDKLTSEIKELKKEIQLDFSKAIEQIELAYGLEPENLHIIDQLARLYYRQGELHEEKLREEFLRKSVQYYEKLLSYNDEREPGKKQEAAIFMAMALGKLNKPEEASRLINTVVVFTPLYYLSYFVKSCIYSINANKNSDFLNISYNALEKAIELNPDLKENIKGEIDLYNLRFDDNFKNKFAKLIKGTGEKK
jgi:transcriptional regulator with XRE-family HTH domain